MENPIDIYDQLKLNLRKINNEYNAAVMGGKNKLEIDEIGKKRDKTKKIIDKLKREMNGVQISEQLQLELQ